MPLTSTTAGYDCTTGPCTAAAGMSHTCVVMANATNVRCFGSNRYGQLGTGDSLPSRGVLGTAELMPPPPASLGLGGDKGQVRHPATPVRPPGTASMRTPCRLPRGQRSLLPYSSHFSQLLGGCAQTKSGPGGQAYRKGAALAEAGGTVATVPPEQGPPTLARGERSPTDPACPEGEGTRAAASRVVQ